MPPQAVRRGARHPLGVDPSVPRIRAKVGAIGAAGAASWRNRIGVKGTERVQRRTEDEEREQRGNKERKGSAKEKTGSNRERSVARRGVGRVKSETDPRRRPRPSAGFLRVQIGRIWDLGSLRRHPHGGGGEFLIRSARA